MISFFQDYCASTFTPRLVSLQQHNLFFIRLIPSKKKLFQLLWKADFESLCRKYVVNFKIKIKIKKKTFLKILLSINWRKDC